MILWDGQQPKAQPLVRLSASRPRADGDRSTAALIDVVEDPRVGFCDSPKTTTSGWPADSVSPMVYAQGMFRLSPRMYGMKNP